MRWIALMWGVAVGAVPPAGAQLVGRLAVLERGTRPSRDLSDAVVWLDPGPAAEAGGFDIVMSDKVYVPRVLVVPLGATVRFLNRDPFDHNVFAAGGEHVFDLGLYGRGETRSATFRRPGLAHIYCNVHPRMVAFVVVMPGRYYTQPAADGAFRIDGVPAGRYRLHAWHERVAREVIQEVTVGPAAETRVEVTLDARGYRWQPHRNKFGREYPTNAGRERY